MIECQCSKCGKKSKFFNKEMANTYGWVKINDIFWLCSECDLGGKE